jgi:signal transduction histidine kinase
VRNVVQRLFLSLRVRVTLVALLAVGAALAVSAVVIDASLQRDRHSILMATADEQVRYVTDFNPNLTLPLELPRDATIDTGLVEVLEQGKIVAESRPLRPYPPLWLPGEPSEVTVTDLLAGLGKDIRLVAVPVTSGKQKATVVVVTSLDQYDRSVSVVDQLLQIGIPVLLLVVGVICWMIVGRALRPIELMRRQVASVAGRPGLHRVKEPATDDEVGRLARTLNSMLDRIESSSERERRFVSDASHELRSPIANIRTELEVALHRPTTADWPAVADGVLGENERMDRLVEGLLLLARSDEGGLPAATQPVDLAEVVSSVVEKASPGRSVVVSQRAHGPVRVDVPPVYLERVVSNLVDNACRFAENKVAVTARVSGTEAILEVRDDGPGIAEADRERIFERFVRLDEARDRGEGGFGLGLSIVATLCRAYGGSIEVRSGGPGAVFVARFPLASTPPTEFDIPKPAHDVAPAQDEDGGNRPVRDSPVVSTGGGRSPTAR